MKSEHCILMLADDDPDDRELIQEAFLESGFQGTFRTVEDGAELLHYLKREAPYQDAATHPIPHLILLDLNMPKIDGYEVLARIKGDDQVCQIPVIVLTTSKSREDVEKTYELGGNSFLTKPSGFNRLVEMAKGIDQFWLKLARLPQTA